MASRLKKHVLRKVYDDVFKQSNIAKIEQVAPYLSLRTAQDGHPEFRINTPITVELENEKEFQSALIHQVNVEKDKVIEATKKADDGTLILPLDVKSLVKDTLDSDPSRLSFLPASKRVIVEFSSPNVAKPFHVGHLRSTIIGNFVANIKKKMGKDVHRINYLGDWDKRLNMEEATHEPLCTQNHMIAAFRFHNSLHPQLKKLSGKQYGLLKLGMENLKPSEDALQAQPTQILFDAYVWANREANSDPTMHDKAREEFRLLETGDETSINTWKKFKDLSVADLERTYKRLGVKFDEFQWESDFGSKEVDIVLNRLNEQGLLRTDEKDRKCARTRGRLVPLVKSDGATLYLARDVAAVMHRRRSIDFHEMYYVVENGQADHFQSLFSICSDLNLDQSWNLRHVKFGRIHGMSTRRGKTVFLHEILDQARDLVFEGLKSSKTTKVEPTLELADALGCASVIVNDLKQHRTKDYDFSWDKVLQVSGDTAVRLQYTHCRLCSLLSNSAYTPAEQCDPDALSEPEAVALVVSIARFEEAVLRANSELESCILVNYLFHLTHAANRAFKVLPVKDSGGHLGSQRLLLFSVCKKVIGEGLELLGITPLEQM